MPATAKAVVTAAAPNQHTLPLQRLVDRDGQAKTVLQLIIEEVTQAGIEQIGVVIQPGDQDAYVDAASRTAAELTLIEQPQPNGYGDLTDEQRGRLADLLGLEKRELADMMAEAAAQQDAE